MRLEPALSERKAEQLAGINNSTLTIESCRSGLKRGHQISGSMNECVASSAYFWLRRYLLAVSSHGPGFYQEANLHRLGLGLMSMISHFHRNT